MRAAMPFLLLLCACSGPGEPPAPSATADDRVPVNELEAFEPDDGTPRFVAQAGWLEQTPSSNMRVAQYGLSGKAGEAQLVVYHFPNTGASLEANLERWAGQFEQPDGSASAEHMQRRELTVGVHKLTVVDLSGTYVAETSPGSGEHVNEPDWRMLAAVIESPKGPYYAKLTGPSATVAAWQTSFDKFLDEL